MRTAILCGVCLIVGAVAGAAISGYFVNQFHKRYYAFLFVADLGSSALQAELIKQGDAAIVLDTLEKTIPLQVIQVHENESLRSASVADTSMMATKRFYMCTGTPIPVEIDKILEPVTLPEGMCDEPKQ